MSEAGFEVFDIGVNILESFLHVWFVTKYLGERLTQRKKKIAFITAFLMLFLWWRLQSSLLFGFEGIFVLISPILLFGYSCYALEGGILEKIFVSMLPLVCTGLINSCVSAAQKIIFSVDLSVLVMERSYIYAVLVILTKVLFIVVALGILRLKKQLKELPENKLWILFIMILCTSLVEVFCIYVTIRNGHIDTEYIWYLISVIVGIILMDMVTFYFLKRIGKETELQQAIELLKQNTFYQQENVKTVLQEQERTRQMRHDVKNVMLAMSGMIQEGRQEEALRYCHQYMEDSGSHGNVSRTGMLSVDNLIVYKLNQAADDGIQIQSRTSTIHTQVDEMHLCVILGSVIDNAIEALQQEQEKHMELIVEQNQAYVSILVKNNISGSVLSSNPQLLTTKEDKGLHGFGLRNVRRLVKQYEGMIEFLEEKGMFVCHIEI